jgi:hypothetical protein
LSSFNLIYILLRFDKFCKSFVPEFFNTPQTSYTTPHHTTDHLHHRPDQLHHRASEITEKMGEKRINVEKLLKDGIQRVDE